MLNYFYYDGQLRKYLVQFCSIFAGMHVQTGNGECGAPELMSVPIRIGSKDRVVAAIEAGNTQNKPMSLPMLAAEMTGISLAVGRKGVGVVDRRTYLPEGGVWPTDLKTAVRVMPIPYIMSLELAMYASNTVQLHQMLEQILMLFDPQLQIQTTDAAMDWTKISTVELTGINNEENYPAGGDRRVLVWTLNFEMPIYIAAPVDIKDDLVRKIFIRIGDLDTFVPEEIDPSGNIAPFEVYELNGTPTIIEINGDEED